MTTDFEDARDACYDVLEAADIDVDRTRKSGNFGLNGKCWVMSDEFDIDGEGVTLEVEGGVTAGKDVEKLADQIWEALRKDEQFTPVRAEFAYLTLPRISSRDREEGDLVTITTNSGYEPSSRPDSETEGF